MTRTGFTVSSILTLALLTTGAATAQMPEGYLDVLTCKVRPEKRADFDAIVRKMADANRRHNGDAFIATNTEYGEGNTVTLISVRPDYGAIEQGMEAYEGAMKEGFGTAAQQIDKDFNGCLISSRAEVRRRRWDLSINAPADTASYVKLIGESRWVRTVAVTVRPGRLDDFEAQAKLLKSGLEKISGPATLVSQSVAGQHNTVFYFSTLRTSLAGFDAAQPPLREILGEEGYRMFQRGSAENVMATDTTLARFLPELSNPPKEIAEVSPDFWNPKPAVAAKSKPKAKPADPAKP